MTALRDTGIEDALIVVTALDRAARTIVFLEEILEYLDGRNSRLMACVWPLTAASIVLEQEPASLEVEDPVIVDLRVRFWVPAQGWFP